MTQQPAQEGMIQVQPDAVIRALSERIAHLEIENTVNKIALTQVQEENAKLRVRVQELATQLESK